MTPDRIPSDERLREIIRQASRYIEQTRRLLKAYPEGRAPAGATDRRDIAIEALADVLSSGDAAEPYGWTESVCAALEAVHGLAHNLTSWCRVCVTVIDIFSIPRPAHDDEFNVQQEELALARWKELVGTLKKALDLADPLEVEPAASSKRDLVTLNQAAGIVHRSKRTLERYKTNGKLPDPIVEGGGGKPDLYEWATLRSWLEQEFAIKLPETFPASRRT